MSRPDSEVILPEEPVFIILWEDDGGQQGFALSDLALPIDPDGSETLLERIVDECNGTVEKSRKYHKDHFEALGIIKKQGNVYVGVDKATYEPLVKDKFKQKNREKRLEIDAWKTANISGYISMASVLAQADLNVPLDKIKRGKLRIK